MRILIQSLGFEQFIQKPQTSESKRETKIKCRPDLEQTNNISRNLQLLQLQQRETHGVAGKE